MIVSDMLPELLFSVGSGMQDFGKDELGGLLGTGVVVSSDKDHSPSQHTLHSAASGGVGLVVGIDDIKLTSIPELLESSDGGKLEEVERDLYPWHTGPNIGSRFLRSSDDPLISGGTNDNPHDNELSVPTVNQSSMCPSPTTPPPHAPKHRHSSVLPPELAEPILSPPKKTPTSVVPEPSPSKQPTANKRSNTPRARRKGPLKLRFHHQALPQEYLDHYEATQNNLHKKEVHGQAKSTTRQRHQQQSDQQSAKVLMERQAVLEREERANESVRSWLQKILELQQEGVPMAPPLKDEPGQQASAAPTPSTADVSPQKRIVSYTDLPYMGEITLDNCKPRRGRKPKKADICHLIYKNYGTILPGTPTRELTLEKVAKGCSKSVASLLERRLTASDERAKGRQPTAGPRRHPDGANRRSPKKGLRKEEPLNLCVRDSGGLGEDALSLSSDPDTDPDEDPFASSCPTPIITPSDLCTDQALAANMKLSLPTLQSSSGSTTETPSTADTPPGYMYWSSSNTPALFAHPMGPYFPAADGSPASSPAVSPDGLKGDQRPPQPLLVPKHISQLIKPTKTAAVASTGQRRSSPIPKRKRSAIFIPPVPAENSSNPATEVSICKFKFTGGAKPCLQEKKILSVDSGGNFRYYSGTGDKSMRGYEFFPRESLQQSSITATSTTGAFLNASGERIACDLPPPSLGLSNDLLQIPDFPTSPPHPCSPSPSIGPMHHHHHHQSLQHTASERRRRKSRRATQRESLEKTFKEKGFLIQTQQMQSAEGATYCKFRQLRKFTRYLFRSWKDYLPGDLQQQQQQQQQSDGTVLPGVTLPPAGGMSEEDGSISSTVRSRLTTTQQLQHSETYTATDPRSSPGRPRATGSPSPRRVD
ncbi:uncharacterized protein LOC128267657 [Anopheles cruzii]|uniref:uncharacterized protein LOC128267657 n=1 Tax=Anopheles cruzii TaxID=68878 RepID=UPI0022EC6F14|nr:uncharacterized protein LOC128267657 [Anopheles cruzii]